jgi:hypothetical protein
MAVIPNVTVGGTNYRTVLGAPLIGGNVGAATVDVGQCSHGFAAYTFDPSGIDSSLNVTAKVLLKYSAGQLSRTSNNPGKFLPNPILPLSSGFVDDNVPKIIPNGTRSLLFFGIQGIGGYSYGSENNLVTVDWRGQTRQGRIYENSQFGNGFHSYPYYFTVFGFDLEDLKKVNDGTLQPDQVKPNAKWHFTLPYTQASTASGSEALTVMFDGVYAPSERTIFLSVRTKYSGAEDEGEAIIHGFRVRNAV